MKKYFLLNLLILGIVFIGCRPEQPATEWNITDAPQTSPEEEEVVDNVDLDSDKQYQEKTLELNYTSSKKSICEPLGSDDNKGAYKGLVGNLRLIHELDQLPPNSDRRQIQSRLQNYLDPTFSYEVDGVKLFLSQVNVPERSFLEGFSSQGGEVLQVNGENLFEFFNINLSTILKIEQDSMVGDYEFATLSDDGSKVSLKRAGALEFSTYLNSDIEHAPKFICAPGNVPDYVSLNLNNPVPMKINYFQGPRQHIALQLFWRKKVDGQQKSSLCGVSRPSMESLSAQGWEIVPAEVFNLPDGNVNPCVDKEMTDRITNLTFYEELIAGITPDDLVKSVKVYVQDSSSAQQQEYGGEIHISYEVVDNKYEYTILLDENDPILRDSDKKIVIAYKKLSL